MPAPIKCATCGKLLTAEEAERGHVCKRPVSTSNMPAQTPAAETPARAQELRACPRCKRTSLSFDERLLMWQCLNPRCRRTFTKDQLDKAGAQKPGLLSRLLGGRRE